VELVPCTAYFAYSPPNGNIKISPYTNMTLTLALGWNTLFMEDMGEGALDEEKRK
jgi:hypothetical protein